MTELLTPAAVIASGSGTGLLVTAFLLGIRHGFDWDHIAAITDIASTTATAQAGLEAHERAHRVIGEGHHHPHGGPAELRAHEEGAGSPGPSRNGG